MVKQNKKKKLKKKKYYKIYWILIVTLFSHITIYTYV